jgi:hypothetical protein
MTDIKINEFDYRLTRRGFLKLVGISAAALSAGYGAGKISLPQNKHSLTLQAFLPADELLVSGLVDAFVSLTGSPANIGASGEPHWADLLQNAAYTAQYPAAPGMLTLNIMRLQKTIPADLLLSDSRVAVYDPERHFNRRFIQIRQKMYGLSGGMVLTAVYKNRLETASSRQFATIRDQAGLFDRLPLDRDYKDIPVDGPLGKTHLRIAGGMLWIHSASCRQHLCQEAGRLAHLGDRAACAPNRLLVEIESG